MAGAKLKKCFFIFFMVLLCLGPEMLLAGWPEKPITILVPYRDPGFNRPQPELDFIHELAPRLSRGLGVPVTVSLQPGGHEVMAANRLASAKPDGYLIAVLPNNAVISRPLQQRAPYLTDEFLPVGSAWITPYCLIALKLSPYSNLKQLADYSVTNGPVRWAHSGVDPARPETMDALRTAQKLGIQWEGTFYPMADHDLLFADAADVVLVPLSSFNSNPDRDKLKILAVFGPGGSEAESCYEPSLSVENQGMGDELIYSWTGFYLPGKTRESIAEHISGAIVEIMSRPNFENMLYSNNYLPQIKGHSEAGDLIEKEVAKQRELIKHLGLMEE